VQLNGTQPARFYFCVYTQVIVSALAITVTSARSRHARKYFLYTCAHTHTFAPPAPPATQGSPLLGVGWTVPEPRSLTLRVISPRLPELKIRMWHTYCALRHDLWHTATRVSYSVRQVTSSGQDWGSVLRGLSRDKEPLHGKTYTQWGPMLQPDKS
jgi:hypothetical protein